MFCFKRILLLDKNMKFKRFSLYSLILLTILPIFIIFKSNSKNASRPDDYLIISATYYNKSTIYPDNTIVILFNADKTINPTNVLNCITKNNFSSDSTLTVPQVAFTPTYHCKHTVFIAVCNSVPNPTSLGLTQENGNVAHIPIRKAYSKKTPVVVCFSPAFYFEKWELLITSLEIYKYYGAHLQVLYVQSMLEEIYLMLKLHYESDVILEPFPNHDVDEFIQKRMGFDPNLELAWRNQAASHTDCLLKYREAAEFIIVGDVDDILIPFLAKNYLSEFRKLSNHYKNSTAFGYHRHNTVALSFNKPTEYSVLDIIESMKISDQLETYKYVINPKRVETAWLHWPGITKKGYEMTVLDKAHVMVHLRNLTNVKTNHTFNQNLYQVETFMTKSDMSTIHDNFIKRLRNKREFLNLPTNQFYHKMMDDCYEKIFYSRGRQPTMCPGPARCEYDPQPGVHCIIAKKRSITTKVNSYLTIISPSAEPSWILNESGCFMR